MKKHSCSIAAMFAMIALAFGSADTNSQNKQRNSTNPTVNSAPDSKVYKIGDTLGIGYTSYRVWRVWWADQLSDNQFLNQRPNASYLFVELTVRNDDKQPRTIPPFTLMDENKSEYETSPNAWALEQSIGILDSLNPGVTKQGVVVFDVPRNHSYTLKVSGGYWSGDEALISLDDSATESPTQLPNTISSASPAAPSSMASTKSTSEESKDLVPDRDAQPRSTHVRTEVERRDVEKVLDSEQDDEYRTWTSASGKHTTEAKILSYSNGIVTIQKRDGTKTRVDQSKLSQEDRDYIQKWRRER